ncbi:MAG: DUF1080 domain-containing protein [Planctomycetota bacterium]|nr:DUF1080 domain-containing protein [Planctomycetota bacterium]MDA1106436.1 DUF1080 domain-containing protein [Planctomycetota bacterium]
MHSGQLIIGTIVGALTILYGLREGLASARVNDSDAAPGAVKCPDGARPLFNGVDLTGWGGERSGYSTSGGVLRCLPSCRGDLVTQDQYADFRLTFEFRLQPGSNNGIGIRAPMHANAAYDGMEIQVLDDSLPRPTLHPYQRHGSIYGIVPALPGCLVAPGQWNREVITALGTRVTVELNGLIIVDADLHQATANGTMDGQSHPGLFRHQGHIHLCGHGDPIEFRNMCIETLHEEPHR